ncbi:MAG: (d)CMP kinase, partial [Bdellovibrionota bacterium]
GKTILEGRDIGTVVFPDADVKFFLVASVEERSKRRLIELEAAGADAVSFEEVKKQIAERDHGDSTRAVAPLKRAEDAIEVDTTSMTLDEVVKKMETLVRGKLGLHD